MATLHTFDYIVAGGGQAGCVVASRLATALPHCTVALIEGGPDAHDDPRVQSPLGPPKLHNTELEWNYVTAPQKALNNRQIYQCSGKLLSGSSAVNYGAWVRGHFTDFDEWGQQVQDLRWSYAGLLKYFQRTETHFAPPEETENAQEHGFEGPIHTHAALEYPMGGVIKEMFSQNGAKHIADANSGQPLGLSRWTNNWHNYARQPAGKVYNLSQVKVFTDSLIHKLLLTKESSNMRCEGIELANGQQMHARHEVIVSAGALRTPQLLMISGIGDAEHLRSVGIEPLVDAPQVGQNLHDHGSVMLYWKLKHPEKGYAMGSNNFPPPKVGPSEWIYTGTCPQQTLRKAIEQDGVNAVDHPQISKPRAHYEITIGYGATAVPSDIHVPMDGSSITTGQSCFQPTSRGTVKLASAEAATDPIIDPNYFATEQDRCIVREAMRFSMRMMQTPIGKEEIAHQYQANDMEINLDSSDEELDARIRAHAMSWYHPGGTAAMGTVVDSECRVMGVDGLRVVDASIIPKPIGTHYQALVYALAEQASDMIAAACPTTA